jgi:hypothetical protein
MALAEARERRVLERQRIWPRARLRKFRIALASSLELTRLGGHPVRITGSTPLIRNDAVIGDLPVRHASRVPERDPAPLSVDQIALGAVAGDVLRERSVVPDRHIPGMPQSPMTERSSRRVPLDSPAGPERTSAEVPTISVLLHTRRCNPRAAVGVCVP